MAHSVLLRTHLAGLTHGYRPAGYHTESAPGVGKSDMTEQYVAELATRLNKPVGIVIFMLATISSPDVRGFMLPVKNGDRLDAVFSTPPWMPTKANVIVYEPDGTRHKAGTWTGDVPDVGVLFLDEFSQADEDVKKPAAELVYKGEVGTARLPEGWRVVSAGNRTRDRSGVNRELMFIVNRRCRLEIESSLPAWLDWAGAQSELTKPHYLTMSFAQKEAGVVFQAEVPDGSDPFCTPRTICLLDRDLRALREPDHIAKGLLPMDDAARELAIGWIGDAAAAQYFTHLKYAAELPDMEDIIRDPASAKMPPNKDAQMVCSYMLAHNLDTTNAEPVFKYLRRMAVEMQVMAVRNVATNAKRASALTASSDYTSWLIANKDLLIASKS